MMPPREMDQSSDSVGWDPHFHPIIVLFDFDGVLLHSRGNQLAMLVAKRDQRIHWNPTVLPALRATDIVRLFERSARARTLPTLKAMYLNFYGIIEGRLHRWITFGRIGRLNRRYESQYNRIFPAVPHVLTQLRSAHCILGIVSNSSTARITRWLERDHLDHFFSIIVTGDLRKQLGVKPDPRLLLHAIRSLKRKFHWTRIDRRGIFYIGDNQHDIRAAHGARIRAIAVASGHDTYKRLQIPHPEIILPGVAQLPQFLADRGLIQIEAAHDPPDG